MTLGTKSLLFGVHQFIIHPVLVTIAWVKIYKEFPNWRELVCIFIHDWGYWGVDDLKAETGDKHPELGARIAFKYLGLEWADFILGHSSFYIARSSGCNGTDARESKLFAPDKYWHCIIPLWFYKLLAVPSGEFKYYRDLSCARQVANQQETDIEWWEKLQEACMQKIEGSYRIDMNNLR